ncbi:MAG: hypothetical protein IKM39_00590 [Clostridia bacterium]|nr:hypothetical protein [Clostridia bacterium]
MANYISQIDSKGTIAADDTLLVKGVPATAGSKMIENFVPLFSAHAVEKLEQAGYQMAGKTNVGEFGLDIAGEFSYYAGKDSAAALIAGGAVKAALGVDMNGAPRRVAALCGVDFLKPTYGTVSRYGVISCAASGEQVGVYAGNVQDVCEIMSVIAGYDPKDGTCLKNESYEYSLTDCKGKKVALVKDLFQKADDQTKEKVMAYADTLKAQGVAVEEFDCDLFTLANTAWQILMCAETCNNVSRYDGVKFGYRAANYKNIDELYVNSRTEGFNFLTKAVILYGSDVLSKHRYKECYDKSLRVRRVVAERMANLFESYDAILTPACSQTAFESYDIKEAFGKVFAESEYTALANLIGIPALVSGGVQLLGNHFDESKLLSLANCVERKG